MKYMINVKMVDGEHIRKEITKESYKNLLSIKPEQVDTEGFYYDIKGDGRRIFIKCLDVSYLEVEKCQ